MGSEERPGGIGGQILLSATFCQWPGPSFLPLELAGVTAAPSPGLREVNKVTRGSTQLRARPTGQPS